MVISGFASLVLLVLAVLDSTNYVKIWHVILLASIQAFVMGFDGPVRSSFFPLLIERKHMMSAVALGSIMWQFSRLVTPVLGGIIIRYSDTYTVFYIAVLGWITMFIAIYTIKITQESSQKHCPNTRQRNSRCEVECLRHRIPFGRPLGQLSPCSIRCHRPHPSFS